MSSQLGQPGNEVQTELGEGTNKRMEDNEHEADGAVHDAMVPGHATAQPEHEKNGARIREQWLFRKGQIQHALNVVDPALTLDTQLYMRKILFEQPL